MNRDPSSSAPVTGRRRLLVLALRSALIVPAGYLLGRSTLGCGSKADCRDVSGLTSADLEARETQNYMDPSPDPDKFCSVCKQYKAPPDERTCAGCAALKGPVAANGSCKLFEKRA